MGELRFSCGKRLGLSHTPFSIALPAAPPKLCKAVTLQKRLLAPGVHLAPKSESETINTSGHGLGEIILPLLLSPGGCLCKHLTLLVPSDMKNNTLYPSEISFLSSLVGKQCPTILCSLYSQSPLTRSSLRRGYITWNYMKEAKRRLQKFTN